MCCCVEWVDVDVLLCEVWVGGWVSGCVAVWVWVCCCVECVLLCGCGVLVYRWVWVWVWSVGI